MSILRLRPDMKEADISDAVHEIMSHLRLKIPEVPPELTEPETRIEYMLRPSGAMRRRVELKGQWWNPLL